MNENDNVLDWLHSSDLKELIPVFEREQLLDWAVLDRLSLSLLMSLNVPLGMIFRFETLLKGKKYLINL